MKRKVIKLTESDLNKIVKKVIKENEISPDDPGAHYSMWKYGNFKDARVKEFQGKEKEFEKMVDRYYDDFLNDIDTESKYYIKQILNDLDLALENNEITKEQYERLEDKVYNLFNIM